jgi:hypothetical protein
MARRPSWRLAAVVLTALLGLTVVAAIFGDEGRQGDPVDAPQRFLDAWARSRAATYRSVADFTRTSNTTGAALTYQVTVAQRPPDRFRVDNTGARGLVDGQRLTCTFHDGRLRCQSAAARRTYDEEVADQLASLEGYVTGDQPLYRTDADLDTDAGDCFELSLEHRIVAPPLGIVSRYCFDPATGAPTDTRVEAVEAVDVIHNVQLEAEVTDADLDPDTALG